MLKSINVISKVSYKLYQINAVSITFIISIFSDIEIIIEVLICFYYMLSVYLPIFCTSDYRTTIEIDTLQDIYEEAIDFDIEFLVKVLYLKRLLIKI